MQCKNDNVQDCNSQDEQFTEMYGAEQEGFGTVPIMLFVLVQERKITCPPLKLYCLSWKRFKKKNMETIIGRDRFPGKLERRKWLPD